jgi:hypothetical protein
MPPANEPYLSLVVTTRNDDHGGDLLRRTQAFFSGWIEQANRHHIPSELIIVEWNPPQDRPPLREVLRWPADLGCCDVRFIEVPPDVHRRYQHAAAMPLYQMIGKNAGIRRARGRFVLATNIDILFSSELAAYLAEQKLESGRMYRIDRHDVMSDIPVDAPIEEQLAYCATHLIRVNGREGTYPVTPEGRRKLYREDLAAPGTGIVFGSGWYSVEKYGRQEPFRWASDHAELYLEPIPGQSAVLEMDLEPGPGTAGLPVQLEITGDGSQPIAEVQVGWRCHMQLPLPEPVPERLTFHTRNGGSRISADPRIMNFRAFRVDYRKGSRASAVRLKPIGVLARFRILLNLMDHAAQRLATGGDRVSLTFPVSSRMRTMVHRYLRFRKNAPESGSAAPPVPAPQFLHTNACGDFTLLAREHWFDLRGYPEFDMYSMNIDSLFCTTAHNGGATEVILDEPMRTYHIEHGSGSGWTPEGQAKLWERLAAAGIPYLDNDEVLRWAAQMQRLESPFIFNHENWGLADSDLKETLVSGRPEF